MRIALALALGAGVVGAGAAAAQPDNVRILTYNTAFMYLKADSVVAPWVPLCSHCDPFEFPPTPPGCYCSSIAIQENRHRFADIDEVTRAEKIAERIVATDQDVVVLNEVFYPPARDAFVSKLAQQGPYKNYISLLKGVPPTVIDSLGDIPGLPEFLPDLPTDFLPYQPVSNDSGLMIFSKYPFTRLPGNNVQNDANCSGCAFEGMNDGGPLQIGDFAFKVFDDCEIEDCLASKGVGLVWTRGAVVAFTHLQSEDEHWASRHAQYEQIRQLILGALPANILALGPIFLAGDLNTRGRDHEDDQVAATQEWHGLFNPDSQNGNVSDGFFACGNGIVTSSGRQPCRYGVNGTRLFTDSWGFETSTTDEDIDDRLDYILHSSRTGRLCMQHIMRAWDLQADVWNDGGSYSLSDHWPVRGDFGLLNRWCSPRSGPGWLLIDVNNPPPPPPRENLRFLHFGPTNCTPGGKGGNPACDQNEEIGPPDARIASAGNFQWFRISKAGGYSIRVDPDNQNRNVDYMVYHHTDLSRPLPPFDPEGDLGALWSMPDPPYYIRTFAVDQDGKPDRSARGVGYYLRVHQHLCRSPADACPLEPGLASLAPYFYKWPVSVAEEFQTELRELWWRFETSGVSGGRPVSGSNPAAIYPRVKMHIESTNNEYYDCITQVAPMIEEYNNPHYPTSVVMSIALTDIEVNQGSDWDLDGLRDDLRLAPDLPGDVDGEFKWYFLKITRDSDYQNNFNVCNAGLTSYLGYLTDLTYLVPLEAEMWAELDDDLGAADNMRIHMAYDAGGYKSHPPAPNSPTPSSIDRDFDEPDWESLKNGKIQGYYVNQVWPTFWEKDEERYLTTYPHSSYTGIGTLSEWQRVDEFEGRVELRDAGNPDEADYYYHFNYGRCRSNKVKQCGTP